MTTKKLDLRGQFDIETPEQVAFRMERAGLGSRIMAALLDTVILFTLYFAAIVAFGGLIGIGDEGSGVWLLAIMIIVLTFLFWGYYIGFELAWNGQTPGKRLLGIRVVGDGGVPVAAGQVVIRNLVRMIDLQFGYAVAMVAIFATRDEKRLGDLAAGTVVVTERRRRPSATSLQRPTARARALDPQLLDLVRDYWDRSPDLDSTTRWRIAQDLANRLAEDLGRPPVAPARVEAELLEMTELVLGESEGRDG